jgi:hypothetical protein
MRPAAAIGAALLVLVALSGCATIGSLGDKAQIDLALGSLAGELDDLAGIDLEYTAELQGDYSYRVEVHATAPQLDTAEFADAALLVRNELGAGVFERSAVYFDLSVPEGGRLWMTSFSITEAELRDALAFASAVGEAYGSPGTLSIAEADEFGNGIMIGVLSAVPLPDWDAIRSLVAASSQQYWAFPGLSFDGDLPPREITDLVDAIGALQPLGFTADVHTSVDWYGESLTVTVVAKDVDLADPTNSSAWPHAQQVAALIAALPVPSRSFMFYGDANQGTATVFFGECAQSAVLSAYDAVLATALGASAQPGLCA